MNDLGKPDQKTEAPSALLDMNYPCLCGLDSDRLPGLSDYDVGEEITLTFVGIVKSKSLREDDQTGKQESIDLELRQAEIVPDKLRKMMGETGMSRKNVEQAQAKGT